MFQKVQKNPNLLKIVSLQPCRPTVASLSGAENSNLQNIQIGTAGVDICFCLVMTNKYISTGRYCWSQYLSRLIHLYF